MCVWERESAQYTDSTQSYFKSHKWKAWRAITQKSMGEESVVVS